MKKILLTCITVGGLLATPSARAQCCAPVWSNTTQNSAACARDCKTLTLKVSGMTCPLCAAGVEKSLKKITAVKAANISLEKGAAVVTFDPSKTDAAKLVQAVTAAGGTRHQFKAEIITGAATAASSGKDSGKQPDACCPAPVETAKKTS